MTDEYTRILVLKGAINELLTNTEMPETQKEDLSHLLGGIRLYRRPDEHMELIAGKLEPLIVAGFTFIRTTKKEVVANPLGGGSQTVKFSRPRQIPELTNSMNNRTVESTLDGWMQYPDADLLQHSPTKAVSKLGKKSREIESPSDKLPLFFKIARERPDHDPRHFPKSGSDEEKEAWEAREAREWIKKVKTIYIEEIDWSLAVEAFENGKKDSAESNLNFTTRLKGLWGTVIETCAREESAVIPYAYQDEPGLVARSITLIEKEMMKEIFKERIRNDKTGMITVYQEFKEEIMKYEQRNRTVNAMLGPGSSPTPPPARTPPPAGAGRGLAGARRGRGRGAVRQLVTGGGRGGGGQGATPPAAQDDARTPGQGADGLPKHVKDIMPHPLLKSPPYDSCRMPPMCANGKCPCVLKYYMMNCQRCGKLLPTCMYREQPREQDPAVLQETRDSDPHFKEFEEASKNLGGGWAGGFHDTNTRRSIRNTSAASDATSGSAREPGATNGCAHGHTDRAGQTRKGASHKESKVTEDTSITELGIGKWLGE